MDDAAISHAVRSERTALADLAEGLTVEQIASRQRTTLDNARN